MLRTKDTANLSISGNSMSATKLQTARSINGTKFDGSASITTTIWGATRTITIGNTSRSVNGSSNVNWSLSEIGASPANHNHNSINHRGDISCETGTNRPALDGVSMSKAYNNGYPFNYGNVLNLKGTGDGQIFIGWSGTSGGHAPSYIRSRRDTSDASWSDWAQIYTTAYKPSCSDIGAIKGNHYEGYWGLTSPDGNDQTWIRAPYHGIIPHSPGIQGSIGSSSWRFGTGWFGSLNLSGNMYTMGNTRIDDYLSVGGEIYGDSAVRTPKLASATASLRLGVHGSVDFDSGHYSVAWEQAIADTGAWFPTFRPYTNNFAQLGSSARRWKAIWCIQSSLNSTSDKRLKTDITPINQKMENLFMDLKPVQYRFIKEYEDEKLHNGFIAQEVEEAMIKNNISQNDFSALQKNKPDKGDKPLFLNEDGEPDYEYGLSYGEFIALNTHMIQKTINEIKDLKQEIENLKTLNK